LPFSEYPPPPLGRRFQVWFESFKNRRMTAVHAGCLNGEPFIRPPLPDTCCPRGSDPAALRHFGCPSAFLKSYIVFLRSELSLLKNSVASFASLPCVFLYPLVRPPILTMSPVVKCRTPLGSYLSLPLSLLPTTLNSSSD